MTDRDRLTALLEPIDLRSEAALDAFIAGLDSPWHSDESRRAWCGLFLRDAAMGVLRLAPLRDGAPCPRPHLSTAPEDVERLALIIARAGVHIDKRASDTPRDTPCESCDKAVRAIAAAAEADR